MLIPKVTSPKNMKQFRPINLCNVIYKLISNTLAYRLKAVLPEIISEEQSVFVGGRLITDNALIAYKVLHAIKNKRTGRDGQYAINIDMSKAYDRIEWSFVEKMLKQLGFPGRFISTKMDCISIVCYALILNGSPHGQIFPLRGLRQGGRYIRTFLSFAQKASQQHSIKQWKQDRFQGPQSVGEDREFLTCFLQTILSSSVQLTNQSQIASLKSYTSTKWRLVRV